MTETPTDKSVFAHSHRVRSAGPCEVRACRRAAAFRLNATQRTDAPSWLWLCVEHMRAASRHEAMLFKKRRPRCSGDEHLPDCACPGASDT